MKTFAEKNWDDCSQAIGYCLNFIQLTYIQGEANDYQASPCPACTTAGKQLNNYVCKKADLSKKDYFQLSIGGMGVSKELKEYISSFGVDASNFRPIQSPRGDVLGYQIAPTRILSLDPSINGMDVEEPCPVCGTRRIRPQEDTYPFLVYNGFGYPLFSLTDLPTHLAEDSVTHDVLVSLELYEYLLLKYPRIECRPIFRGTIHDDREYHRVSEAHRRMKLYKMELEKQALSGNIEGRQDARLRLALLHAAFPVNSSWEIEPEIQSLFSASPSPQTAIIGSFFKSVYNYSSEDNYLTYLSREFSKCSPKEKATIIFLNTLHLFSEGETLRKKDLQTLKLEALKYYPIEEAFKQLSSLVAEEGCDVDWDTRIQQFEKETYPELSFSADPERFIDHVILCKPEESI